MKRIVVLWSILAGLLGLMAIPTLAAGPEGMRLYVFTSGSIGGFAKSALQIGGQGNIEWAPIGFFVIKHPKGNVIFDTGNNDKTIRLVPQYDRTKFQSPAHTPMASSSKSTLRLRKPCTKML